MFKQLCVWEGCTLEENTTKDFEDFFKDELDVRVQFAEVTITNGSEERNEEGGRSDILFYIHDEDISKFALKRFEYGIRWWEDVVSYNDGAYRYDSDVLEKYAVTW